MKATGIVRKVDELGRITLPRELRRTLDLQEKDPVEIYTDGKASSCASTRLVARSAEA